ncbi:MAG: peptide-methionine (S)-S-oxide reductase MsrA [Alphaproteobacteria bacterium]|nr:peptide-methionine (S)-S-oxide reductase MsrA [Alphaproteobacteria bacterium]MBV9540552.1 peptide-methionine (S)-S-oxide reductase MsrA [Alphaproteobacteria bacterium]MBV9904997.1 peptide-methionine (S)-S-oxide reductase MsrA [Alphaproteobacteria bacterium]
MLRTFRTLILAAGVSTLCGLSSACASELNKPIPAAAVDEPKAGAPASETAVIAGGCFWGMQGVFEHVKGVTKVVAGYSGGSRSTATYDMVTTETTGHAESVQITFDPRVVSFGEILRVYFAVAHDPTQLNRQGPDSGTSYRSEIFVASPMQEKIAKAYVAQLDAAHIFSAPIVTKIEKLNGFYAAEDYHQDFLIKNPTYPYIVYNDLPKITALQRVFPAMYREKPVMVAAR